MNAVSLDTLNDTSGISCLSIFLVMLILLIFTKFRWSNCQSQIILLFVDHIHFESLSYIFLIDFNIIKLQLSLRDNAFYIITKFYDNSVTVDIAYEAAILRILIYVLFIVEQIFS